jgi:hypothetical protein
MTPPIVARLYARCLIEDRGYSTPCRVFTGAKTPNGYGVIGVPGRRTRLAHRVAYEQLIGPIPDGLELDHLCRVRACCEASHLEPVSRRENILRGDGPALTSARLRAISTCKHGHELAGDNLYIWRGMRKCRACGRENQRAFRSRKAAG